MSRIKFKQPNNRLVTVDIYGKNHIHKEYKFDEIWDTVQREGYTIISLKMNRYETQP